MKLTKSNLKSLILISCPNDYLFHSFPHSGSPSFRLSLRRQRRQRRRHHSATATATRDYLKLRQSYNLILTFSSADLAQV